MLYEHPFYKKKFETVVGETLFFNYITYKINDNCFETFIFNEDNGQMLNILDILNDVELTNNNAAITINAKETQELWNRLKEIGDKLLTEKFSKYLEGDSEKQERSAIDWLRLMRKKNE